MSNIPLDQVAPIDVPGRNFSDIIILYDTEDFIDTILGVYLGDFVA